MRERLAEVTTRVEGRKLLDLGCGMGTFLHLAQSEKWQSIGVDLSKEGCQFAREQYGLDVLCSDLFEANFPSNYFDAVTLFHVLEHVPDPKSIIKACYDLVKPGGLVFFSTINRNLKSWALAIIGAEHVLKLIPKGSHHYDKLIRPKELHQWCRECDLNIIEKIGIHYSSYNG